MATDIMATSITELTYSTIFARSTALVFSLKMRTISLRSAQFRLLRLLILFHLPKVCKVLDGLQFSPEMYASGVFLTGFGQRLAGVELLRVWDTIVVGDIDTVHAADASHKHQPNCLPLFFIVLHLLSTNSSAFLSPTLSPADFPQTLLHVTGAGIESVGLKELREGAFSFMRKTPASFRSLVEVCVAGVSGRGGLSVNSVCFEFLYNNNNNNNNNSSNNSNNRPNHSEKAGKGSSNASRFAMSESFNLLVLKSIGQWSCIAIGGGEAIGFALKNGGKIKEEEEEEIEVEEEVPEVAEEPLPLPAEPEPIIRDRQLSFSYDSTTDDEFYSDDSEDDVDNVTFEEMKIAQEQEASTNKANIKISPPQKPPKPPRRNSSSNMAKREMKYTILDCRPLKAYNKKHVGGSIHLDDSWNNPEELENTMAKLKGERVR